MPLSPSTSKQRYTHLEKCIALAKKSNNKFIAQMAHEYALCRQLPHQLREAGKRTHLRLEERDIADIPPFMARRGVTWTDNKKQIAEKLDISADKISPKIQMTKAQKYVEKWFTSRGDNARKIGWEDRIGEEAERAVELGWYPLFITLTADHEKLPPQFNGCKDTFFKDPKLSTGFFLQRLREHVRQKLGYKQGAVSTPEFFRYVGVIEHGQQGNHPHFHCLALCKDIPEEWKKDPNDRNPVRRNFREIEAIKSLWPYGWSSPQAFRCIGDVWTTRHHWNIPQVADRDSKQLKPLRIKPAYKAGTYFCKYLLKGDRKWHHRMKSSRAFGLNKLTETLSSFPEEDLRLLTEPPQTEKARMLRQRVKMCGSSVRRIAEKLVTTRMWMRDSLFGWLQTRPRPPVFSRILQSVADGHNPTRMPLKTLWTWLKRMCYHPEHIVASEPDWAIPRQEELWAKLCEVFPPKPKALAVAGVTIR